MFLFSLYIGHTCTKGHGRWDRMGRDSLDFAWQSCKATGGMRVHSFRKSASAIALMALSLLATSCAPIPRVMTYPEFREIRQPEAPMTLAYGEDALQRVHLWRPAGKGPFPVAMLIHGGCWQTSVAKADIMSLMAKALAERGVAVWNVEYRGVDMPGGGYPGTFEDIAGAADLLAARGREYDLDPRNVLVVGHSAGGHLGLWLAGRHSIDAASRLHSESALSPRGVLSIGGLPNIEALRAVPNHVCGDDTVDKLVGPVTSDHRHVFADTSPLSLLPLGVPQMLVSGSQDSTAPPALAQAYVERARAKGDSAMSVTVARQGHFELITPGTRAGDAVIEAALVMLGVARR